MNRPDGELGTAARFIAAGGASTVSAVVVNPFDVVKVALSANVRMMARLKGQLIWKVLLVGTAVFCCSNRLYDIKCKVAQG